MASNETLWSDEWTGERWTYGLTYRGLGTATVPSGWLIDPSRAVPNLGFTFGTVQYPRERLAREMAAFELTLVSAPSQTLPDTCPGCHTPNSTVGGRYCAPCRQ